MVSVWFLSMNLTFCIEKRLITAVIWHSNWKQGPQMLFIIEKKREKNKHTEQSVERNIAMSMCQVVDTDTGKCEI